MLSGAFLSFPWLAYSEAGRTAALFLSRPMGARAAGMGQAYVAMQGDVNSLGLNPAALATLMAPTLSAMYSTGLSDDAFGSLAYGHPTLYGTLGAGVIYLDGGRISLNLSSGLQESRRAEQDTAVLAAYAAEVLPGLFAGVSGKWISLELVEQFNAKSQAVDGGILWKTPVRGLALGAALQNLGKKVAFEQEGDPLPKTWRAGAAYQVSLGRLFDWGSRMSPLFDRVETGSFEGPDSYDLLLALDETQVLYQSAETHLGLEIRKIPFGSEETYASFRAGYVFNRDIDSFSLGMGVGWRRLLIDYAFGLVKDLNSTHRISVGMRF